jgi:hypothetical protein
LATGVVHLCQLQGIELNAIRQFDIILPSEATTVVRWWRQPTHVTAQERWRIAPA